MYILTKYCVLKEFVWLKEIDLQFARGANFDEEFSQKKST